MQGFLSWWLAGVVAFGVALWLLAWRRRQQDAADSGTASDSGNGWWSWFGGDGNTSSDSGCDSGGGDGGAGSGD